MKTLKNSLSSYTGATEFVIKKWFIMFNKWFKILWMYEVAKLGL